jgi:hypothetical protein
VDSSFESFCLTAGIGAIEQILCEDVQQLAGTPHNRGSGRIGHRWGRTKEKIGFHDGKVAVYRPRVRSYDGHEVVLPTWTGAQAEEGGRIGEQRRIAFEIGGIAGRVRGHADLRLGDEGCLSELKALG